MSACLETVTPFEKMALDDKLKQALKANGYITPTEIQTQAIPVVLEGRDLMASAKTGSGKTVAFVLPILQLLLTPSTKPGRGPRVLVLTPTRELADQVTDTIWKMCKFTQFRSGTITGGVPYPPQERLLSKPVDLLVATPGRLIDHMNRGRIDFSRLETLVLDEADRMLDMGFMADIERILEPLPQDRQIVLFSATLEGPVQKIARQFLRNPVSLHLAHGTQANALISQRVHQADDFRHKRALLTHILEEPGMWQAIVFTGTKRGAEELAQDLSSLKIMCAALHGDMKQSKRTRTLERMHRGQIRVLIATDVAARGIDVKKISHVINFDMPKSPEDYVHRIGRTGRCGETGIAISLIGPKDWPQLARIERVTGQRLERQVISGLEPRNSGEPRAGSRSGRSDRSFNNRSSSGNNRSSSGGGYGRNRSASGQGRSNENGARRPGFDGQGGGNSQSQSFNPKNRRFSDRPARSESDSRNSLNSNKSRGNGNSRFSKSSNQNQNVSHSHKNSRFAKKFVAREV